MRTGAATGHVGCLHEAVIYDSDDELVAILVPYLEAGIAAGEPAVASLSTEQGALVRSALNGATPKVTFLPASSPRQERPPATIKLLRSLLGDLVAAGADQVRVVSTTPHPGLGAPWDGWCRYEAAVNDLLGDLPMWNLCLYDRRITPAGVLADVERTHTHLAAGGRHVPNDRYQDPTTFLRAMPEPPIDPLEAEPPAVELADAAPAASRQAVRDVARDTHLSRDDVEDLVLATSEAVSNAIEHGRPPVRVRVWAAPQRMVVAVSDRGDGPQDLYAGLVPQPRARSGGGGYGLWLMNQLITVFDSRDADGYTVHLIAGDFLPLHHGGDGEPGVGISL
jgi:anti-sigma regulatory factor (Ser/Thr protein kinase)